QASARRGNVSNRNVQRPGAVGIGFGVVGIAFVLVATIAILGSFTQVGVGEVGIVKHFGAIDPEHPDVFDPGIHTKVPFRDDVVIFDTRIQKEQVQASAASKDGVTITNYEFPKEFNDAILATQVANQQNLQAKQLQEKARTEADTALIVAQGLANAQKAQATTLTPEYLQLQAIQKWNGQLPQYLTPNTALPFIGTVPQTTR